MLKTETLKMKTALLLFFAIALMAAFADAANAALVARYEFTFNTDVPTSNKPTICV